MIPLNWSTQKRNLKDLKPYGINPRMMSREEARQLANSFEKFGYCETIAINQDGTILAGHMRVKVMKQLKGYSLIDVRVPSRLLTDEECKEYIIRSNQNTGEWDWDCLAEEWNPIDLAMWGFSPTEMTEKILHIDYDEEEKEEESELKETCNKCGQKLKKE